MQRARWGSVSSRGGGRDGCGPREHRATMCVGGGAHGGDRDGTISLGGAGGAGAMNTGQVTCTGDNEAEDDTRGREEDSLRIRTTHEKEKK